MKPRGLRWRGKTGGNGTRIAPSANTKRVASGRSTATLRPTTQLFIADHRQYRPQPLVVGDGTLVDLAGLVEGAVSELNAVVADRKPAIGIIDDSNPLADRRLSLVAWLQDEDHLVVLQRQRL